MSTAFAIRRNGQPCIRSFGFRSSRRRAVRSCRAMGTAAGVDAAFAVWNVVTTFSDNDISAYSGRTRPGFEKAPGRK